jgi:hypothetical protein
VKVATSKYFSELNMTIAKEIVEKVKVSNNSKPLQWDGKKGNSYLMWKIKYQAHMVMLGLEEALTPVFTNELPAKEKDVLDVTTEQRQKWANAVKKNKKAMMKFALSFQRVAHLNKLNCASRANKDWPSGKAHEVMTQLVKEYEPEDTMAKMEMEKALSKLTLTRKKDPNEFLDKLSAIKCRYNVDMSESKKTVQEFGVGRTHYAIVISTTQMIWRENGKELTYPQLRRAP